MSTQSKISPVTFISCLHFRGGSGCLFTVLWGSWLSPSLGKAQGRCTRHPVKGRGDSKSLLPYTARITDAVQAFQTPLQKWDSITVPLHREYLGRIEVKLFNCKGWRLFFKKKTHKSCRIERALVFLFEETAGIKLYSLTFAQNLKPL